MAGGNSSKNKGSGAERELAKFLSELFDGSFIRSPGSGAYIGGLNNFRKAHLSAGQIGTVKGDLVCPDFMPKMVIESKFYKEFRFHQLFQPGPCAQLETWIAQCGDVVDPGDFWLIAIKINLLGWSIVIPEEFIDAFLFENFVDYTGPQGRFYVTELKSFFENNRDAVLALSA